MATEAEEANGLARDIVRFCRFARERGLKAGVAETMEAIAGAVAVGVADRSILKDRPELKDRPVLKAALRAVLCSSREEWDRFDQIFEEFWRRDRRGLSDEPGVDDGAQPDTRPGESQGAKQVSLNSAEAGEGAAADEGKSVTGASAAERMRKTDFSSVAPTDLHDLERLAARLLDQMSLRLSRRMRAEERGRVDLRRTIRASIGSGGDPVTLRHRGRVKREPRLVILIDVSGSMDLYSLFLLRFAYALHRHFRYARSFIFSTGPIEVTEALNSRRLDQAFKLLGSVPAGWSGGTRIGETLGELNRKKGSRLLSRDTLFIIFSDGLETGDPRKLEIEMKAIKRRAGKVIWLNPLAGMNNYQPLARGMSAVFPYIDCFAAANNLASLLRLEKLLVSGVLR
jgi:uncharacterized protein with von Willebrand factor type A (vWA) domain